MQDDFSNMLNFTSSQPSEQIGVIFKLRRDVVDPDKSLENRIRHPFGPLVSVVVALLKITIFAGVKCMHQVTYN